jgi:hypothetical protein
MKVEEQVLVTLTLWQEPCEVTLKMQAPRVDTAMLI